MGKKGEKMTSDSVIVTETLLTKLQPIDGITAKKMFGGHGIFHEGKMFGIVNSKGECFLKADDTTKADFITQGANKHSRMPYYSIPEDVIDDNELLSSWVEKSIAISK